MTKIRIQVLALLALTSTLTYAQEDNKKGYLTGSFETNTIYFLGQRKKSIWQNVFSLLDA